MNVPKDPAMLLSVINTALRDTYPSLEELCSSEGLKREEIVQKLDSIGWKYNEKTNRFE